MPVILIFGSQDIPQGDIGRDRPFGIKLARVTNNPHEFTVVATANPMAGHSRITPGRFPEIATQRFQALHGNGRLPSTLTFSLCKLVQNTSRLRKCPFAALRDK
jgi:hypothetical protein